MQMPHLRLRVYERAPKEVGFEEAFEIKESAHIFLILLMGLPYQKDNTGVTDPIIYPCYLLILRKEIDFNKTSSLVWIFSFSWILSTFIKTQLKSDLSSAREWTAAP